MTRNSYASLLFDELFFFYFSDEEKLQHTYLDSILETSVVSSFPFLFLLKTARNCSHSWFLVTSNWPSPTPSLKTTMSEGHFRLTSQYLIRDSIKAIRRASMISWPITNSSDNFTNLEEVWIYDFFIIIFFSTVKLRKNKIGSNLIQSLQWFKNSK